MSWVKFYHNPEQRNNNETGLKFKNQNKLFCIVAYTLLQQ